jgi:hypothetical protein
MSATESTGIGTEKLHSLFMLFMVEAVCSVEQAPRKCVLRRTGLRKSRAFGADTRAAGASRMKQPCVLMLIP